MHLCATLVIAINDGRNIRSNHVQPFLKNHHDTSNPTHEVGILIHSTNTRSHDFHSPDSSMNLSLPNELMEEIFLAACGGKYVLDLGCTQETPPIQNT